ncbi:glycosyltransferase 87 family protein [Lentzea sp. BCCO 10_0856]|uniref:Glycosyltransferase 87 family protein n=1 Tax=Lentzea miocenica TaxID=3095431 RepID=A0ABU4SXF1_9PSEU|nr:glycosyltransferase 87 family protein [Lentzea sp. BCCO 10_0856]MDX8030581.1 glycosyltransferase 87 family protein [Lentzea sp. BCCO 10_0856]
MNAVLTRVDLRKVWAVVAAGLLVWIFARSFGSGVLDLRVYLAGGEAWRSGTDLYTADFQGPNGLPFTYPPLAAMLFSGLTPLPLPIIAVLFTAAGIALFTAACHVAAQRLQVGCGLAALCLLLEPLRGGLDLGQINMILIGLVAADCLLPRTPWPRGTLVGLAAAIKLTPAIFVLFFLSRKRWRPALTAVGTFAGAGLVGWVLAPGQSKQFWFDAMLDPQRVGGLAYSANQSLRGLLFRLGAPESVWMVLCLLVLAATVFLLPRLRDDLTALLAVAAAGLLISPVSWSHHWVWIAPALLLLHGWARIAVAGVFALGPHWLLPTAGDRELAWAWWQHLIGNAYVWLALAFLVWCAVQARRDRSPARGDAGDPAGYLTGTGSLPSSARAFRRMSASS